MPSFSVPRQLVVVVAPLALVIMGDSLMYVLLPAAFADFGVAPILGLSTGFWVGLALSINRFVRLVSNHAAARVYERAGLRAPFIAAVFLGGLTTLTYAVSTGIAVLLLARLLWGVAFSFMRLASQIVAFNFGSNAERGRYLGFFNMGQRAGSIVAVTGGAALASAVGSQPAMAALAGIGVVGVVIAMWAPRMTGTSLATREANSPQPSSPDRRSPLNLLAPPALPVQLKRWVAALSLMRFSIAFAANGLAIVTISPYLARLLAEGQTVFGISVAVLTLAGLLVGTRWLGDLALSMPSGALSDRLGRMPAILAAVAVMLAALVLAGSFSSLEMFLLAMPLLFFASVLANTSLDASLGESVEDSHRAAAFARYSTWSDFGSALGPLVGLTIAEVLGFQGAYLLAAAVIGISLALLMAASRLRSREHVPGVVRHSESPG